ncbi:MBL fold metallo-hydrolase [Aliiglaciecola sp.]|nr:MBL fold metallo-hydrolase [Aliiglaciecola sp.]
MSISVHSFFHKDTGTASYVVIDASHKRGVIIDSVLDLDIFSGQVGVSIAEQQLDFIKDKNIEIDWILETHAHADHLSAAAYLQTKLGAKTAIGKGIEEVQRNFSHIFTQSMSSVDNEKVFDQLLTDGQMLHFGDSQIQVMATPGHTDDSVSYLIDNHIFVGDTLFMPDSGTARCDFPGGSASKLWASIKRIHALPEDTNIWVCHDYQPNGREVNVQTTVLDSKLNNIHVNPGINEDDYISMRTERDKTLSVPRLIYPSLQVNLWSGALPAKAKNGVQYFSIPLTTNF